MNTYQPEGMYLSHIENHEFLSSRVGLEKAMEKQKILEAVALLCDSDFNLHFDLGGITGIMPREEVMYTQDGEEIKDIAVLTRVGKPVCFKIIGFSVGANNTIEAILSRRAAQRECMLHYISTLVAGDVVPAVVTHLENFGAFVDIGCGIISLLSIDSISVSRISHPRVRFMPGDKILAVVKNIDEYGRIYMTHRELLGTWEENAVLFSPGQTVAGVVRSIENYGVFVELTPNLAGLAELKEGVEINQSAAVYIKSIIPEKMKIKLIIIDSHMSTTQNKPIKYFVDAKTTTHIDRWCYSPACSSRVIESVFV
ncbi:MAG: 30S ribosomal protein S1 [Clostridia bacterium]|nr:30S ribosomal protein S1 [Clostridia bacterium]